jgi:hypothetical protein
MQATPLENDDLAPTTAAQRTWGTYNYIALWFSMSMEITTYMLASSLIAGGMNWLQAVGTILLGNLIVLIPMLLNAHAGAKYGIPFPVFVRASFGLRGANVPAMLRAVVACGWFGIQAGDRGDDRGALAGDARVAGGDLGEFFGVLAAEYGGGLEWSGVDTVSAELLGSVYVVDVVGVAGIYVPQGGRVWADAGGSEQVPHDGGFPEVLFSFVDRDGGVLGDAFAEYPRFYAVFAVAREPDRGAGVRFAGRDDTVLFHRNCVHKRFPCHFWDRYMVSY